MICHIVLRRENNKYVARANARAKEWPEITVFENSRDAAIQELKPQLLAYLTNEIEVVQVKIPLPAKNGNPWLDKFGSCSPYHRIK